MRNFRLLILTFVLLMPQMVFAASPQWISPQRVHHLLKEGSGLWIVDVRSPAAFDQGHIESAVNIPVETLKFKNLPKSKMVVLVDDSLGLRNAGMASDILVGKSYGKVFILDGGLRSWQSERLPWIGKDNAGLHAISWEELTWAHANSVPFRLLDLRDRAERRKGPVERAATIEGSSLAEKLQKVKMDLAAAPAGRLAKKLEKPQPVVLVLPNSRAALETAGKVLRGLHADLHYLEGAYPLWVAREKQKPLTGAEVCRTCAALRGK